MTKAADSVFVRVLARERQRIGELERSLDDLAAELERLQAELVGLRASPPAAESSTPAAVDGSRRDEIDALRAELAAAKAANQAKSMFLAHMSHELRIPLNGLVGAVDVLSRTRLDDKQQQLVSLCQQSNTRVLRLIGDVLDFSRIEQGRLELQAQPFCVQEVATELAELFANEVRTRGLKFHLAVPAEPLLILRGDPNRIDQIVSNLLHNACKFTPSGNVGLRVDFTRGDDGRYTVRWAVSDSGVGIADDEQGKLFDVFAQASNAQRKQSGAGLGLSIVKSMAVAMGGGVQVQSKLGKGSTFTVTTVHEPAELGAEVAPAAAPNVDPELVHGLRVLVVDDHPVNRTLAEAMLRDLGCDVVIAANGEEAVAKVPVSAPDLVLMDCHMPGMSGIDAARAIRKAGYRQPIVAVSADVSAENRSQVQASGMQRVLGKPYLSRDLVQAMAAALGRTSPTPANAPAARPVPAGEAAAAGEPAAAGGDGVPVFDSATALHLVGGNRELVVRLVNLFLEQLDTSVAAITAALQAGDAAAQKLAAHALKGSAAVIGAQRLRELAARLEREGRDGRCRPDEEAALRRIAAATAQAMRAYLAG
jgi:signal transduction histidine kinase/HPt (histidine-containing phosphotransfer) domain-containing protein/ActR/RegA family two-component response regulator